MKSLSSIKEIINMRILRFLGVFQEYREIERGREQIIWERAQTLGPHQR